jgi:site-specific recombinase XerD
MPRLDSVSRRRRHLRATVVLHAVRRAVLAAGIPKRADPQSVRQSLATHLLEDGSDIRTVQELLGDKDVATTMIHTPRLQPRSRGRSEPRGSLARRLSPCLA